MKMLYNCATPKWFLQYYFRNGIGLNITEERNSRLGTRKNVYEYDSDGFPTKRTDEMSTGTYKYRVKLAEEAVAEATESTPAPAAAESGSSDTFTDSID
jgi:hypothetical protein